MSLTREKQLEALIARVQWYEDNEGRLECPWCDASEDDPGGHYESCEMAQLMCWKAESRPNPRYEPGPALPPIVTDPSHLRGWVTILPPGVKIK